MKLGGAPLLADFARSGNLDRVQRKKVQSSESVRQQLPLTDLPQIDPLTVHEVAELAVAFTLMLQLPDGFGPNEIPPTPENVSGKASALFRTWKAVANVTLGSPLNVTPLTAHADGVTVSVELSLPFPELSSVYMKSPLTPIVPPFGQGPW
jgi:hypothetical protein